MLNVLISAIRVLVSCGQGQVLFGMVQAVYNHVSSVPTTDTTTRGLLLSPPAAEVPMFGSKIAQQALTDDNM